MLKSQDMLVLAALLESAPDLKLSELAEKAALGLGPVHRSIRRLQEAGLVDDQREVRLAQADEFLSHALRYVFPPIFRGESRGVPTSWAAPSLRDQLASDDAIPPVWADRDGDVRGIALEPLHPVAVKAAQRDRGMYSWLALLDALRSGDARLRGLARDEMHRSFAHVVS